MNLAEQLAGCHARDDYASWRGVIPADDARNRASLAGTEDLRAYWLAYAAEVDRLQREEQ